MKQKIREVLLKNWGYSAFRPLQEDIILSVLEGKDTLALLPTGGGKSVCFQVPALAKEGICIVVTPLIALMKDQVQHLVDRKIKAVAIYSGMTKQEIDVALDNAVYDKEMKFLYLSPERLKTEMFRERLKKMNVSLLAVDEAHCISQWGYDFRPPYLEIAEIRSIIPEVPVLAVTATATPEVVDDIQKRLLFKEKNLFQKSFLRKNLTYMVFKEEDKLNRLLRIMNKIQGTAVIYARNRRKTKELAAFLRKNGIAADFYHAGLDSALRDKKQQQWMNNVIRVMVCTNAFGMGIDKPDVRLVMHLDIPDNLEAYFQEAGRGGRDGKQSWAIMLYEEVDIKALEDNFLQSFPEIKRIRECYNALGNYLNLAVGSGKDQQFDFDIVAFAKNYNFPILAAFNILKILEKEGYLFMSDSFFQKSKIYIKVNHEDLYQFQLANKNIEPFIKLLLRSYSGLFNDFVNIDEKNLAFQAKTTEEKIKKTLELLTKYDLIDYIPQNDKPKISFLVERLDAANIMGDSKSYLFRKETAKMRLEAVKEYVLSSTKCRSQELLAYFGEEHSPRCGNCDVCKDRNSLAISQVQFDLLIETIKPLLQERAMEMQEIMAFLPDLNEDQVINGINWLLEKKKIRYTDDYLVIWNKN
jgi:ATP-dependent DNA helicase RecQ